MSSIGTLKLGHFVFLLKHDIISVRIVNPVIINAFDAGKSRIFVVEELS